MRILTILAGILATSAYCMDMDAMYILSRQAPIVNRFGDYFVENNIYFPSIEFIVSDTSGSIVKSCQFDPTPDNLEMFGPIVSLNNGNFEYFINREREGQNTYGWPYMYRFHLDDTGFVEEQFHEIDINVRTKILDAKRIETGDYLILYKYGDDESPFFVARVTPEGAVVWIREIVERGEGSNYGRGIVQRKEDAGRFLAFGLLIELYEVNNREHHQHYAFVTEIDTSGEIITQKRIPWATEDDMYCDVSSLEEFSDGTFALLGYQVIQLAFFHLDGNLEIIDTTCYMRNSITPRHLLSLVIEGDKLLIGATHRHHSEGYHSAFSLWYLDEDGDSLDGHIFSPDTVHSTGLYGPMLQRPDGKVMLWVYANSDLGREYQMTDILYTFYPDGRPDAVSDDRQAPLPSILSLSAFPNPFNASTTLMFDLEAGMEVRLTVVDPLGRRLHELIPVQPFSQGSHSLRLDAGDLPSGAYWVRLESGSQARTNKLILIR